jgi:predicted phosphodiesterase
MLRILSDLHFRDASSRLTRLEALDPLLEGVDELWLNGDTCDNQTGMTAEQVEEIKRFFAARVPRVRYITGNHDPDISTHHEASAANGQVWATHGDVFLDDVVPWSSVRPHMRARLAAIRAAHPQRGYTTFEDRIATMREACTGFRRECDPERRDFFHRLRRTAMELFPPRQPLAMLHTWRTIADSAVASVADWRPAVRVIVTGHVHFPRVWPRGDYWVINLGAFCGPLGALTVEMSKDVITVRRVTWRDACCRPGAIVREIPLASAPTGPLSPAS